MIYAASPALDGLRYVVLDEVHYLQDAYRGPVWEEVIIHLPRRGATRVPVGHVSNAEELAEWIDDGARPDRDGDRGATAGRARRTSTSSATASPDRLHLLPTLVDGRPNPEADAPRRRGAARARPIARGGRGDGCYTPRRVEVVELLEDERMLPAIYFIFSRAACDDAAAACLDAGLRLTDRGRARRIRAIVDEPTARPRRRRPRRARLRPLARRARGGHRRPPRRDGAAVQGGGRGLLRRGAREGGVRHRDARARHQHAGPLGRDREAHEVHRRAPRVPHAGRVHAAHRPGRAARHRRRRLRHRAVVAVRALRPGRRAGVEPHASRCRRRSGPPTTWRPTSCAATRRRRPTTCSTCRSRSSRPTATSCGSRPGSSDAREVLARPARRGTQCERGDVEEYRRTAPRRREPPRRRARARPRSSRRSARLRPGDVIVAAAASTRAVSRC